MSFLVSEELSFRIPVELGYESCDPYAVRLTFHLPGDAPVTWTFGRELLIEIISSKHGAVGEDTVARALQEIYQAGLKPDWWKLEPQANVAAWPEPHVAYEDVQDTGAVAWSQ